MDVAATASAESSRDEHDSAGGEASQVLPEWGAKSKPRPKVEVKGIEGTLANFDVRVTMENKSKEFAACHEPRVRRVPPLSGSVEFGIEVKQSGEVAEVSLNTSDVGDRELERCFVDVIRAARFPKPNGGDAKVKYTMLLAARKGREPEQWDVGRIQRTYRKHAKDVGEECGAGAFTVTAYVNARGRVLSAGLTGPSDDPEKFDCVAKQLRRWNMPRPAKKRFAKVTFALSCRG